MTCEPKEAVLPLPLHIIFNKHLQVVASPDLFRHHRYLYQVLFCSLFKGRFILWLDFLNDYLVTFFILQVSTVIVLVLFIVLHVVLIELVQVDLRGYRVVSIRLYLQELKDLIRDFQSLTH